MDPARPNSEFCQVDMQTNNESGENLSLVSDGGTLEEQASPPHIGGDLAQSMQEQRTVGESSAIHDVQPDTSPRESRGTQASLISTEHNLISTEHEHSNFASRDKVPWFLKEADPDSSRAKQLLWRTKRNVVLSAVTFLATLVLLVNCITTLVLSRIFPGGVLLRSGCETTSSLNTFLHLLVNILSTALLGCSNLCMQLLVAPTRQEVESAHAKKPPVSLDIGIPSISNLRFISRKRVMLWVLLGAASFPLHLLYNSVFFATQPINTYTYLLVQPSFIAGAPIDMDAAANSAQQRQKAFTLAYEEATGQYGNWSMNANWRTSTATYSELCGESCNLFRHGRTLTEPSFANITSMECLQRYRSSTGNHSDVIVVTTYDQLRSEPPDGGPLLHIGYSLGTTQPLRLGGNGWVWGSSNNFSRFDLSKGAINNSVFEQWNVFGYRVDYCLSRQWDNSQVCALGFSVPIFIAVCVANFAKVVGIAWTTTIYSRDDVQPLSTLGDALASFLLRNDSFTKPLSMSDWRSRGVNSHTGLRLYQTLSRRRWLWLFGPVLIFITVGIVALYFALTTLASYTGSTDIFRSLGFGKVSEFALSTAAGRILPANSSLRFYLSVIYTNAYQLVLSLIYFQYNGVLTAMLASREWTRYSDRKSLRLTFPEGTTQRTSYFVSMPWRFGGPLLVALTTTHWLLSQSIFVVPLEQMDKQVPKKLLSKSLNTVNGFSVVAIITTITFGVLLCVALCMYGCRRVVGPMPQGRPTKSITISSACHPPLPYDRDARLFPVVYGIVPYEVYRGQQDQTWRTGIDHAFPGWARASGVELQSIHSHGEDVVVPNSGARRGESDDDGYLTFTTYMHTRPPVAHPKGE